MKIPAICQLCDFGPEVPGSFVDSMLTLAGFCRHQMALETFFIFPERAKKRKWLSRFGDCHFPVGFVPPKRNIVSDVRALLKDYNPLIFHTHFSQFDFSPLLLKFIYYRNSKVVWSYHNPPGLTTRQRIKDLIKIRCLGGYLVHKFIAVGDAVYTGLLNAGLSEIKVALIYNGIDVERFSMNDPCFLNMRNDLGIPDDGLVFLLLGWDPSRKGVDIFLRAVEEAMRNVKCKAIFIIVGREETRKMVSSSVCQKQNFREIIRVIDPVPDFPALLSNVDVFVSCSRSEGSPYAVLEAMAAKKVILSSDIQIPVISGPHGRAEGIWIYSTEDWKALSELMEKILKMEQIKRASLGSANYTHVKEFYSVEIWAEKMGEVYSSLLKNP